MSLIYILLKFNTCIYFCIQFKLCLLLDSHFLNIYLFVIILNKNYIRLSEKITLNAGIRFRSFAALVLFVILFDFKLLIYLFLVALN